MNSQALQNCLDQVQSLVEQGSKIISEYQTSTSVSEIADCASDQCEETVYLTPEEMTDFYAAITREVFYRFGFDGGASDASDISLDAALAVGAGEFIPIRRGEVI